MDTIELKEIEKEIQKYISKHLIAANIPLAKSTTFNELGIDSYSLIEMLLYLEAKYHCSILDGGTKNTDLVNTSTLALFIHSKL